MRTKKTIYGIFAVAAVLILAMIFTACEGPEGPIGPEGPQGPAGGSGGDPNCVHAWKDEYFANTSTCTESGKYISSTCLKCSAFVEGNISEPKGHQPSNPNISTQPTETADGQGTWDCSRTGCTSTGNSVTIPAWNKFYGTWVYTSNEKWNITKTTLVYTSASSEVTNYEIISWTPIFNTGSNNANFPSGYDIKRKNTSTNVESTMDFYLHTDMQSILRSNIATKQE